MCRRRRNRQLEEQVEACRRCPLWQSITHKVVGQGDRQAPLMLFEIPEDVSFLMKTLDKANRRRYND